MKPNMTNVGQGRTHADPADAIRAETGEYKDAVNDTSLEDRLPTKAFPMAKPQPPFTVRSKAGGSR